jgi:hypothetical protein
MNQLARPSAFPLNRIHRDRQRHPHHRGDSLRLARYFDTSPEMWINLQAHYDLSGAR